MLPPRIVCDSGSVSNICKSGKIDTCGVRAHALSEWCLGPPHWTARQQRHLHACRGARSCHLRLSLAKRLHNKFLAQDYSLRGAGPDLWAIKTIALTAELRDVNCFLFFIALWRICLLPTVGCLRGAARFGKCTWPGLRLRPSTCGADVVAARPQMFLPQIGRCCGGARAVCFGGGFF